jgi:nitric oxide-associated protein 1
MSKLNFQISDYRLFLRTKRLTSERVQKSAEANLRQLQARETRNPKYATLIGHIGRTFDAAGQEEIVNDQFSMSVRASTPLILTLNEKDKRYVNSKWCYDTPGVVQPDQILNLLTTEELLLTIPKRTIRPRVFLVKRGMSLFLAGLGRIDYEDGLESIRLIVYASPNLPVTICGTEDADDLYEEFLGTEVLAVPFGGEERLDMWPKLENSGTIVVTSDVFKAISCCGEF